MRILYLLHAAFEMPGAIEAWASQKGFSQAYISPYAFEGKKSFGQLLDEVIPSRTSIDLIIAMGGPQSPLAMDKAPYLKDEIAFIRSALKAKIPVLGFCLGAQLIGEALGASTERSPYKEVGVFPIELTEEGKSDPLLVDLPSKFLVTHWHNDMPGLTKDSVILAKSAGCPRQIIRYAPLAYGFQCHPEITLQLANGLITNCPEDFAPGQFVQSPQKIVAHDFNAINQKMILMLDNCLAILKQQQLAHIF